jgi:hypothetical protein
MYGIRGIVIASRVSAGLSRFVIAAVAKEAKNGTPWSYIYKIGGGSA